MDWKASDGLKTKECMELFAQIKPRLIQMELKNVWDAAVNDMKLSDFIQQAYHYMYEVMKKDLNGNVKYFQCFPKVKDFLDLYDYILAYDFGADINKELPIYELVENEWVKLVNYLFD